MGSSSTDTLDDRLGERDICHAFYICVEETQNVWKFMEERSTTSWQGNSFPIRPEYWSGSRIVQSPIGWYFLYLYQIKNKLHRILLAFFSLNF